MNRSKSFFSILIPSATVFFSSACIMILELVAGRLIAKHLGSSLYTWTSVIGVVLAGITIGNYIGGRIADRFCARKAIAVLFGISSLACVVIVVLNNVVGKWALLSYFSWPWHVFSHVSLVFLIPSTLLGTISPVVAKTALEKGLPTGRTVGDIYAWGAAGSIAGTFLAGFYLIAAMGTTAIIWIVGFALLLMAILYWARFWVLYIWGAIFTCLMTMGMAAPTWAETAGSSIGLREKPSANILYEDESQYCYIAVRQLSKNPDRREFVQDKLKHSEIIMGEIRNLQYFYQQIYAAVTHRLSQGKDKLSTLTIGGGGYVFPRYVKDVWPQSRIDVVEIDPGVTEAAIRAFGLERDTPINTITMDARNYVDEILTRENAGAEKTRYDFIYGDAVNGYSVPYQLVTRELNDKIAGILTDNGVYMINLIDIFDSGLFVGAVVNTLKHTFPNVYVLSANATRGIRNTFVVIAARQEIDLENLTIQHSNGVDIWYLDDTEINTLKQKSRAIILTDDYVPVENMLAPVVRQDAMGFLSEKYLERAQKLRRRGKLDESITIYKKIVKVNPAMSISACSQIALMSEEQGRLEEAAEAFQQVIEHNEQAKAKINVASIHLKLGFLLKALKRSDESREHFRKAISGFLRELAENPRSSDVIFLLGVTLSEIGQLGEAAKYFQQAVNLNSSDVENHLKLAQTLLLQERYDKAIEALNKAIGFMNGIGDKKAIVKLQKFLELAEFEKSKRKN